MTTTELKQQLDDVRAQGKRPRLVRLSDDDALQLGTEMLPFLQIWRGQTDDDVRSLFNTPQLLWGVPAVRWDGATEILTEGD